MIDRGKARYRLKQLQRIKTWQLLIILILSVFVSLTFLRLNNIGMVERRNAVLAADESGDSQVIQDRLYELQRYVSTHMNADLGDGVALSYSYQRDHEAALERAAQTSTSGNEIYQKAYEICTPRFSHYSQAYAQCITSELAKYPDGTDLIDTVQPPNPYLYTHRYASPLWSPDFAGWSVLLTLTIALLILVRLAGLVVLRLLLRKHRIEV